MYVNREPILGCMNPAAKLFRTSLLFSDKIILLASKIVSRLTFSKFHLIATYIPSDRIMCLLVMNSTLLNDTLCVNVDMLLQCNL